MGKRFLLQVAITLLWLTSTALGMIALLQTYEATRVVAAFVIPVVPQQTAAHGPRVTFVARVTLIILGVILLVVSILLLEQYHGAAAEPRLLVKKFVITTIIELGIIGLATAIIYQLPGLVMGGTR